MLDNHQAVAETGDSNPTNVRFDVGRAVGSCRLGRFRRLARRDRLCVASRANKHLEARVDEGF